LRPRPQLSDFVFKLSVARQGKNLFRACFRRSGRGQTARFVPKCKQARELRRQSFFFLKSQAGAEAGKRRPKKQNVPVKTGTHFSTRTIVSHYHVLSIEIFIFLKIFFNPVFSITFGGLFFGAKILGPSPFFPLPHSFWCFLVRSWLEVKETKVLVL